MKYRDLHGRWGGDDAGGGNRVCWSGASVGRAAVTLAGVRRLAGVMGCLGRSV